MTHDVNWLTLREAVERFGIPESRLESLAINGTIAARVTDGELYLAESSIWEWIELRKWEQERLGNRFPHPQTLGRDRLAVVAPPVTNLGPSVNGSRHLTLVPSRRGSGEPTKATLDRLMMVLEN